MAKEAKVERTEEEISKEIQELNQKKAKAFVDAYNALVKEHGMQLVGVAMITPEGVKTDLDIRQIKG